MIEFPFEFSARLKVLDFGRMAYTVVYAPKNTIKELHLAERPRLRIDGVVNGRAFHGAFNPAGDGMYYLILSKKFCKNAHLEIGDRTLVSFDIADQDSVDVPRELELALRAHQSCSKIWDRLSSGKKRGFAYRVSSARRTETRERRVEEVLSQLISLERSENR